MTARKPPSDALLALCERVNEEGCRRHGKAWKLVGPRQIERWANGHLIPPVKRPGRGRGLGREPHYNHDHIAAIVDAGMLVHRHRSIAVAGAVLFMQGRSIPVEMLRRSYAGFVDRFDAMVRAFAEKQRQHLKIDADEQIDVAELAEPLAAQQLASHPDMRELRTHLKESGLGVQSTLEVVSAVMIQIFSTGTVNESDLEKLQSTLNLPTVPIAPEVQGWLPSDDQIRQASGATAMKEIIDAAAIDDFSYARAAAITLDRFLNTSEAREQLAGYGLGEAVEIIEALKDDEVRAMLLLLPLIFRVRFGLDLVPVPNSLISPITPVTR